MPLYQFHGMKSRLDLEAEIPVQRVKRKQLHQPDYDNDMITEEVECLSKKQRWDSFENNNCPSLQQNHTLSSQLTTVFNQVPLSENSEAGWQRDPVRFESLRLTGTLLPSPPGLLSHDMLTQEQRLPPVGCEESEMGRGLDKADTVMECSDHQELVEERVEYCSTSCSGGSRSPVSNLIRCSCMRYITSEETPYCSDYY